jgi:hypothetical protein
VWPMLPVTLGCPLLIATSVFSGMSIIDCHFGFLWNVHYLLPLRFSLECPLLIATSVFSVMSIIDCHFGFLWNVHYWLPLRLSLVCLLLIDTSFFFILYKVLLVQSTSSFQNLFEHVIEPWQREIHRIFFFCTCILKFCNHLCTCNSDKPDLQFLWQKQLQSQTWRKTAQFSI